jgi:hypothetical protein
VAEGETQATPLTFFKSNTASYIDYANVVVDPADDTSFWMVHEFADSAGPSFKMVAGKVTP